MKKSSYKIHPLPKIIFSFIFLIIAGSLLLKIPQATTHKISYIDALFTATSAVCVTGLAVIDTAKDFTFCGQAIILILIQLGGLGILTLSIGIFAILGNRLSLKWTFTFKSTYNEATKIPTKIILVNILAYTFIIELTTAIILFTQFRQQMPIEKAIWFSIFHSISAFCNAGFALYSDSLISLSTNKVILLTLSGAIILGGIGFLVLIEILNLLTRQNKRTKNKLSLHSQIVLKTTFFLIILGTIIIGFFEWDNNLQYFSLSDKIVNAFFQSVTCRTAGFNSIPFATLQMNTLFFMIFLMFIGGSPGSIAGGVKTTTIAVLFYLLKSQLTKDENVVVNERTLPRDVINKSLLLVNFMLFLICFSSFILMNTEIPDISENLLALLFEITSALATVGLSTGITPEFSLEGKIFICIIMFVGRLGPATLVAALADSHKNKKVKYPDERIMIG